MTVKTNRTQAKAFPGPDKKITHYEKLLCSLCMLMFGLNKNEKLFKGCGVVEFRLYLDSHGDQLTEKKVSKEPSTFKCKEHQILFITVDVRTTLQYIRQVPITHRRGAISGRTQSLAPPLLKFQIFTPYFCRVSFLFIKWLHED